MILIVDDDYDIISVIKISLRAGLYAYSFAESVMALKEFRSHPP